MVGGSVVFGLVVFFLIRRRAWRTPNATEQVTDNEKSNSLALPGPHDVEPYILQPSFVRDGAYLGSTVSATGTEAPSTGAVLLPGKSGYRLAETSSLNALSPHGGPIPISGPSTNLTRVEQLHLERERINRELAALEQRSVPAASGLSAYGAPSDVPLSIAESLSTQELLTEQLAILQAQIRQLEASQQRRESDLPPMYDGPMDPASGATGPHVEPMQSPSPC